MNEFRLSIDLETLAFTLWFKEEKLEEFRRGVWKDHETQCKYKIKAHIAEKLGVSDEYAIEKRYLGLFKLSRKEELELRRLEYESEGKRYLRKFFLSDEERKILKLAECLGE